MGNSGSVHHMQSGLKELHSYYQVQSNNEGKDDLPYLNEEPKSLHKEPAFLEREKCLSRSKFSRIPSCNRNLIHLKANDTAAKNSQFKVLPNLTENLRLRSTTNGAILQSGGTISGRKDSLLPQPMVLERSKTLIQESSSKSSKDLSASRVMTRRSQSQINIDLRKTPSKSQLQDANAHYKQFSSKLDLKQIDDTLDVEQNASLCNSSETYQKLSKVKIKNKKRKAPPVPLSSSVCQAPKAQINDKQHVDLVNKDIERKQRLFKTKSETVFQSPKGLFNRQQTTHQKNLSKPTQVAHGTDSLRSSYRSKGTSQCKAVPKAGFRREKSFDATLLSSRNKDVAYQDKNNYPIAPALNKRKSLQMPTKTGLTSGRNDFKTELECRLMAKSPYTSDHKQQERPNRQSREPNSKKPNPIPLQTTAKTSKPETQSKIPQLKKTFYFGMESSKRKAEDSSQKLHTNTLEPKKTQRHSKDDNESTQSKSTLSVQDPDPIYSLNHKCSSEINDNGIQVNVRPTLPRRQLEIPRFSPVAAWRTLSEEYRKHLLEPTGSTSKFGMEAANTFLTEDRIYKTYREPFPFYSDNKSGDSGISGDDAYLPEKPIQPRNLIHAQNECDEFMPIENVGNYPVEDLSQPIKVVGPFLTPWTPQQDLDEEDTSSDGDIAIKLEESQNPTSAHVFSLSLPRENQLSIYGEKSKPDFRSLQKLKRSPSGELNGSTCDCTQSSDSNLFGNFCLGNYRSDNWLLSKTGMALKTEQPIACCNQVESNNKSNFLDLSVSIQPLSLGSLATGKHLMYLPNRPIKELKRQSMTLPEKDISVNKRDDLDDTCNKNIHARNKRFSFQSSVRQIERRRLAAKLSKDAEQKEALRKSELEAMRRVEEEFQRKRAYEKASIRHQLRLYTMDDENFTSLPAEYPQNLNIYRADPDGAVSSTSDSPILSANDEETFPIRKRNIDKKNRSNTNIPNDLAMIFAS